MTPLVTKSKAFVITIGDSDCGKDAMLYNPLRHLAPGIVQPVNDKYFYGEDFNKMVEWRARNTYNVVEVHPDLNLSRLNMDLVRSMYANSSETAIRVSHESSLVPSSDFPVMFVMANHDTYPRRGFPEAVIPKALGMFSHMYDADGEPTGRLMRRFITEDGEKIKPSVEDMPYIPKDYSSMQKRGETWMHREDYGAMALRILASQVRKHNLKHPDHPWDPISGTPKALRNQFKNYNRKRVQAIGSSIDVVAPEIAAAKLTITAGSANDYATAEDAMRDLVKKVADTLYVPGVPGKWITPMVRAPTRTRHILRFPISCLRSPPMGDVILPTHPHTHRTWYS
jgi:hypothetical protein